MDAKQAMDIGMRIAEDHQREVKELIRYFDAAPEAALNGCVVSLASKIMVAIQSATHDSARLKE